MHGLFISFFSLPIFVVLFASLAIQVNLFLNKDCQNYALYLTSAIASFLESHQHFPISAANTSLSTTCVAFAFFIAASRQQFTVSKCLTNLGLLFSAHASLLIPYVLTNSTSESGLEACAAERHPLLLSQAEVMRCGLFPALRFSVCIFARPWLNATKSDW